MERQLITQKVRYTVEEPSLKNCTLVYLCKLRCKKINSENQHCLPLVFRKHCIGSELKDTFGLYLEKRLQAVTFRPAVFRADIRASMLEIWRETTRQSY